MWDREGDIHTYHEEVAPSHPDDADIREGLHDVVECGGGESMDTLRGVGWDGVLCQLPEVHPVRGVRTPQLPITSRRASRVSASPLGVPTDPLDHKRVVPGPMATRQPGHRGMLHTGSPLPSPMWGPFLVPTSTNFLCQASRMAPAFSSLQLMSWIS